MARFILVHGAFTGAWIWGPLAERLRSVGHTVEAFDLPGLGDDATPPQDVTLDSCAAHLGEVLTAKAEPAILVGNSMDGVIATQAAPTVLLRWSMPLRLFHATDRACSTSHAFQKARKTKFRLTLLSSRL